MGRGTLTGVAFVYLLHSDSLYSKGPQVMTVCFQAEERLMKSMERRRGRRKSKGEREKRQREEKKGHQPCSQMTLVWGMPIKQRRREAPSQSATFLMPVWPQHKLHENISTNLPGK